MYWRFGVQGIGTIFSPIGLVKADNREIAIIKMKDWAKEKTDEYLNSFLLFNERHLDGKRPEVVLDWEVNNYIQIVID